ncbi:hypothetical protein BCD64_07140 [Nostoc sp. MBR 210]|nr:hypothetical protein BCD64_07140 [Nostoc sp. MBR 210]
MKKQGSREQGAGEKNHPQGVGLQPRETHEQGSFHPQGVRFLPFPLPPASYKKKVGSPTLIPKKKHFVTKYSIQYHT